MEIGFWIILLLGFILIIYVTFIFDKYVIKNKIKGYLCFIMSIVLFLLLGIAFGFKTSNVYEKGLIDITREKYNIEYKYIKRDTLLIPTDTLIVDKINKKYMNINDGIWHNKIL